MKKTRVSGIIIAHDHKNNELQIRVSRGILGTNKIVTRYYISSYSSGKARRLVDLGIKMLGMSQLLYLAEGEYYNCK